MINIPSRLSGLLFICLFSSQICFSQSQFIPNDTIWKRTVYRMLDLNRPANRNMMYIDSSYNHGGLIAIIIKGLETNELDGYKDINDKQSMDTLSFEEIQLRMGARNETIRDRQDVDGRPIADTVIWTGPEFANVTLYEFIEEYYFDKRNSKFGKKIISICPIRVYQKKDNINLSYEQDDYAMKKIAWIKFDQLKKLLDKTKLEDASNQNSFYHYFESDNYYDSYIIRINNNFDKGISEYSGNSESTVLQPNLETILESRRIEYELHNFEMNLWEF